MNERQYRLEFLPLFEEDLNEIVDYISVRLNNPTAAYRLVDDVQSAIRERLACPEAFEPFPSTRKRQKLYRTKLGAALKSKIRKPF